MRVRSRGRLLAGPLAVTVAVLAGCSGTDARDGDDTTLTVFAAASLQGAFEQLADRFEDEHEGVTVELSLAGSSDLAAQIQQGAPADVFASADTPTMARLVADGLVGTPADFATNTLQIAVPPGNPAGVETLDDLAAPDVALVLCAPQVPCGAASTKVADAAGLDLAPVSEEQSVTDVLGKVVAGEADAGLVYVTDVAAAGDDVEGIDLPGPPDAVNTYPIATVGDDGDARADLAQRFVDLVLSDEGQETLAGFGFAAPDASP